MIEALAAFVGSLAFIALCAKGYAFQAAAYAAIAFKSSGDLIHSRMPNVLNGPWWGFAGVTSALLNSAFITRNQVVLVLTLVAVCVTVAYTGVRAHRLVKVAAGQVGVPWPSDRRRG